ncbi:transglycosylase SLT domain-containing protein [Candidatus Ichthyocystis hellenicum]|uniref:transglycosylase SLT domain-containing protein n=1 Tax=Candidatus Ichthyocystis hellenicum TaxID=1561003 RepID=UPI001585A479|nr:transglycosylase SLT domain-containing protein [Candidatus Ichthyocystis hellenicum]
MRGIFYKRKMDTMYLEKEIFPVWFISVFLLLIFSFYLVRVRDINRPIRSVVMVSRLSPRLLSIDKYGKVNGYEYELAQRLADILGCTVILEILPKHSDIDRYVEQGRADLSVDLSAPASSASGLVSLGPFLINKKINLNLSWSKKFHSIAIKEEEHYWKIDPNRNPLLLKKLISFHDSLSSSGDLKRLQKKFFDDYWSRNFYNINHFIRDVRNKLPRYRKMFIAAARQTHLDWRVLAALAYQESHWNVYAKSPTGVTGFMQLTDQTAKELSLKKVRSIQNEITAAAKYLSSIKKNIVGESDRQKLWTAIAAYNIGLSHVPNYIEAERIGYHPDGKEKLCGSLHARVKQAILTVEKVKTYYILLQSMEKSID